MGASSWAYFVPYQPNIHQALSELRNAVFQSGNYYQREPYWRGMSFAEYAPPELGLSKQDQRTARKAFDRLQQLQTPTTIDELLEWNGEEGTHSILDVHIVVIEPALPPWKEFMREYYQEHGTLPPPRDTTESMKRFGTVSPLTESQLLAVCGTTKPTRQQVEQKQTQLEKLRERGEGLYIVVYANDNPTEIYFTGFSGD